MKKVIYIIFVIVLIVGGAYAWFYFSKNNVQDNPAQTPETSETNVLPSVPASTPNPSISSISDRFPKGETINIGTAKGMIEVKNFYDSIVDTEEGMVIMKDNDDYQLIYDRSASEFFVYLKTANAPRAEAENDLLDILGAGQSDACKLKVAVMAAGQNEADNLSFCAGN